VIYCLLAAGIVFGYAAIKPVLIEEDVYRGYCTKEELEKGVRVCYEQEIRLVWPLCEEMGEKLTFVPTQA
jgi:hypothetical protein